jgi:hypothetical protein
MERQAQACLRTLVVAIALGLGACANVEVPTNPEPMRYATPAAIGTPQPVLAALPPTTSFETVADTQPVVGDDAKLLRVSKRLNCVQFTRMQSGIQVSGNAGTWWDHAKGKYERDHTPQVGAVMVFSGTRRMHSGHVAVVRRVISDREIRIDHANWTNDGQIHLNAGVLDVSPNNDWSQVRVWNTRGGTMGTRVYPIKGFIQPNVADSRETVRR